MFCNQAVFPGINSGIFIYLTTFVPSATVKEKYRMKKYPQYLVALHVVNLGRTMEQAKIILENGADGVLLVNNGEHILSTDDYPNLFDVALTVKEYYPNHVVGINPLDLSTLEALQHFSKTNLDVLWTDNVPIQESVGEAYLTDQYTTLIERLRKNDQKFYGGIAFKYQLQPQNLELVTKTASNYFTVITSDDRTGHAPSVEKIARMRKVIPTEKSLGIASGITADNITEFLPLVDIFIIGTSVAIGDGHGVNAFYYDAAKVAAIRSKINEYVNPTPSATNVALN